MLVQAKQVNYELYNSVNKSIIEIIGTGIIKRISFSNKYASAALRALINVKIRVFLQMDIIGPIYGDTFCDCNRRDEESVATLERAILPSFCVRLHLALLPE